MTEATFKINYKRNDCICGFPSGCNADNCERCKLITRIKELEAQVEELKKTTLQVAQHDNGASDESVNQESV